MRGTFMRVARFLFATFIVVYCNSILANDYSDDFEFFWTQIKDHYVYFDKKVVDWNCVRSTYLPLATNASNDKAFLRVLENSIVELYDPHAIINSNLPTSTRMIPSELDVWAEWRSGHAIITQLRPGYVAQKAGLKIGMDIIRINDKPVTDAAAVHRTKCLKHNNPEFDNWSLLSALAGTHDTPRVITVRTAAGEQTFALDTSGPRPSEKRPITTNYFSDQIAYIAFHNLGDTDTISQFDKTLKLMRNARGLILDLRDTAGGGTSDVAEAVFGRLLHSTTPYQRLIDNAGKEIVSTATPRGSFVIDIPIVALVSRWTGSMGEGMAIGLDAMHRGTVVGTRMAGLNGAVTTFHLEHTDIDFTFPTLRTVHMNGTPRELFSPIVVVDLDVSNADLAVDVILNEGINVMEKMINSK